MAMERENQKNQIRQIKTVTLLKKSERFPVLHIFLQVSMEAEPFTVELAIANSRPEGRSEVKRATNSESKKVGLC